MNENDKRHEERVEPNEAPDVTENQFDDVPADAATNADNEPDSPQFSRESDTVPIESADSVDPFAADAGEGPNPLLAEHSDSRTRPIVGNTSDSLEIASNAEEAERVSEAGGESSLDRVRSLASENSFSEGQGLLGHRQFESPVPGQSSIGRDESTGPDEVSYFGGMIKYVTEDRTSDLNARTKRMLRPTADGGRPLARPVVEVRLSDEQLQRLQSRERLEAARKNEQTCRELVQTEIRKEFWRRDCQDRAIWGR